LEAQVQELAAPRAENPFGSVFIAQVRTDGTWTETIPVSGTMTPEPDLRRCTSSSDPCALIVANASVGEYVAVLELLDPPDTRFVQLNPRGIYAKITASSAVSSVQWNYTAQSYGGAITYSVVRNGMEPVNGSPGKLGITVNSSGTTNGGCTVKAIGTNAEVLLFPDPTVPGGWMFSQANSAE